MAQQLWRPCKLVRTDKETQLPEHHLQRVRQDNHSLLHIASSPGDRIELQPWWFSDPRLILARENI